MKEIVVISGKGGVGKTNFVASLALISSREKRIIVSDCDVDTPNLHLILGLKKILESEKVWGREKAEISKKCKNLDRSKAKVCPFGAIYWDEKEKRLKINKYLCEGCGICTHFFPKKCITLRKSLIGKRIVGETRYGFKIVYGDLKIGESESGKIVSEIKLKTKEIAERENDEIIITDSASGIGCPVIASLRNSDIAIVIFEPTKMSFEYGKRALEIAKFFEIKTFSIINKSLGNKIEKKIENFLRKNKIELLGKIPFDTKFFESTTKGIPIVLLDKGFEELFIEFWEKMKFEL